MVKPFLRVLTVLAAIAFLVMAPQTAFAATNCAGCGSDWVTANDRCQSRYDSCTSLVSAVATAVGGVGGAAACTPVAGLSGALTCGAAGAVVGNVASSYVSSRTCGKRRRACRRAAQRKWNACVARYCD